MFDPFFVLLGPVAVALLFAVLLGAVMVTALCDVVGRVLVLQPWGEAPITRLLACGQTTLAVLWQRVRRVD